MENESEHVTRCPRCFGRDVRPSRKGGFLDSLMGKIGRAPFRCRGCHHRFYVYIPRHKDNVEPSEEPEENLASEDRLCDEAGEHKSDIAKPAEAKPAEP